MACFAKQLHVRLESLKRGGGAHYDQGPEVSNYRFLTRPVMHGSTYWVGQPGKLIQKLFKSLDEAATWVANQRKASEPTLEILDAREVDAQGCCWGEADVATDQCDWSALCGQE